MRSGYLAIWDVLSQQKAVKDWKVSDAGVTSLELHSSGALLSAGASDGAGLRTSPPTLHSPPSPSPSSSSLC